MKKMFQKLLKLPNVSLFWEFHFHKVMKKSLLVCAFSFIKDNADFKPRFGFHSSCDHLAPIIPWHLPAILQ